MLTFIALISETLVICSVLPFLSVNKKALLRPARSCFLCGCISYQYNISCFKNPLTSGPAIMNGLPDVAGSLFTSTYRNVKLAGKAPPATNLTGTGSVGSAFVCMRARFEERRAHSSRTITCVCSASIPHLYHQHEQEPISCLKLGRRSYQSGRSRPFHTSEWRPRPWCTSHIVLLIMEIIL